MFNARLMLGSVVLALATTSIAAADDWTASKLRGQVVQLVNNQWVPLQRGDVVPDTRYIATKTNGHVELTRGNETVTLDPNSQIRIFDKGGARPFTTVKQDFGTVAVEAEVQQVQHFAVQTPYMAAVVKGTRFTVTSGKTGARVEVRRGHVQVDDPFNQTHTTISVGQAAVIDKTSTAGTIQVSGSGTLPPVLNKKGDPVAAPDLKGLAKAADKAAQDALKKAEDAQKKANQLGTKAAKDAAKQAEKDAKDAVKAADKAEKAGKQDSGGSTPGTSAGSSDKSDKSDKPDKGGNGGGGGGGGGDNGGHGDGGGHGDSGGKDKADKPDKKDK